MTTRLLVAIMLLSGVGYATFAVMTQGMGNAVAQAPSAAASPSPPVDWRTVSRLSVVFGHRSVGENVLQGVEQMAARDGVGIDIHTGKMSPVRPGIHHFSIGRNGDPISKIRDFAAALDAGAAAGADVAMMKLCYADFSATSDAQQVAEEYIASLDSLARRHPATNFVAVTVPLTTVQSGPKAWIKRVIGAMPSQYMENARRAEFNERLRERYLATGRLFDLARAESEAMRKTTNEVSGECCLVHVGGRAVETLNPELSSDGGHLNEQGQRLAATAFLNVLGAIAAK